MAYAEPPIPVGNPMKWTATFLDVNGVPFDPDSGIKITITDPIGVVGTYIYPATLLKESVGKYSVTVRASAKGDWVGVGTGLLPDGTPVTTEEIAQKVF